ncbi:hypothetical protein [Candidatus Accumulibacter vicinus]|uniref:Uncharacterized protein n=1 Tax=Candidatus Accumulibacter vicinus TaxID=2954382 RepID=A0A084Y4A9_9PROT|nr:hypothetical protein [Candidatus Accumulibacter vicinus]KFB69553.1 MAG: hypothetical protein CAPSK01_000816 [Candidatus Accumulibacter vicinus]
MKLVIVLLLIGPIVATIFCGRLLFRQRAGFIVDGGRNCPIHSAGNPGFPHILPFCPELRR